MIIVCSLKVKRAAGILDGGTFHRVGVDHRGFQVAVAQQFLDGPDIEIGLEQMAGETVAEGVGRGPLAEPGLADRLFYRPLHMRFMEVIPPGFPGCRNPGKILG